MANLDEGYEDNRFEKEVDRNLHCPICLNVLKDPKQCRRNEHYFCSPCIRRHLEQNSTTCPTCREELTPETLAEPSRIVTDMLGSLKIRCDYEGRGCTELVELEFLKGHISSCEYTPVHCGNDGCSMVINKNDQEQHESQVCEFRVVKCDSCEEEIVYKKYQGHGCVLKKEIDEIKKSMTEMKSYLKEQLDVMKDQMQSNEDKIMNEVRKMIVKVREEVQNATKQNVETKEMAANARAEIDDMKNSIKDSQQFRKRGDIVIAGGRDVNSRLDFAEIFSWAKRAWEPIEPMKQQRSVASSFVDRGEVYVVGGKTGKQVFCSSMEKMNPYPPPGRWSNCLAKLPFKCHGHSTVIHQHRALLVGGYNSDNNEVSDGIYEILLSDPFPTKLLTKMPQKRCYHSAEIVEDKLLVFGGLAGRDNCNCVDSVSLYHISENNWKHIAPLPFPVYAMATVTWKDGVIIIGGADKSGNTLNTVFFYDVRTGRSEMLPSMKYSRVGCAAVLTEETVVVMGGYCNEQQQYLNTVEYFDMNEYQWRELPPMIRGRSYPIAAVKPVIQI